MSHVDPDVLALLALGEDDAIDEPGRAHLATCADCHQALDALRRTVAVGRSVTDDDAPSVPSGSVWQAVHAELGLAPGLATDPLAARAPDAPPELGAAPDTVATPPASRPGEASVVVPLRSRRRTAWGWVAAAACVALVAGVGAGFAWARRGVAPAASTVASATLAGFPDWSGASGKALLEKEPDGTRRLVVNLSASVPPDGFREVWLMRNDLSGLISLGVLDGSTGTFDIPSDLNTSLYSVVDVSQEPIDGNPAHSSDSIVRGPLT